MKFTPTITACLASCSLLLSGFTCQSYLHQTQTTQLTTATSSLQISAVSSAAETLVTEGFDQAIASGNSEQAIESWMAAMLPELLEKIHEGATLPALLAMFQTLGEWKSYEVLGSINLTSTKSPIRAQVVYVELESESLTTFWRFSLMASPYGWKIIGLEVNSERSMVIDDFSLIMLGIYE